MVVHFKPPVYNHPIAGNIVIGFICFICLYSIGNCFMICLLWNCCLNVTWVKIIIIIIIFIINHIIVHVLKTNTWPQHFCILSIGFHYHECHSLTELQYCYSSSAIHRPLHVVLHHLTWLTPAAYRQKKQSRWISWDIPIWGVLLLESWCMSTQDDECMWAYIENNRCVGFDVHQTASLPFRLV